MKDASGYNADLGWRGYFGRYLNFDVNAFYLFYKNRIGLIELTDQNGNPYTYRTNVANSVHKGMESYLEFTPTKLPGAETAWGNLSLFGSFAYIDAKYNSGPFKGNFVEYAPKTIVRAGITYCYRMFSTTFLVSHTSGSFGDATNTPSSSDAIVGVIPSYAVLDWSATLHLKENWNVKVGMNNLANQKYFTLRTDEYPGPGIIPAMGRSWYVSFGTRIP
jgi:Fe(3+) dicitrate transport protein